MDRGVKGNTVFA